MEPKPRRYLEPEDLETKYLLPVERTGDQKLALETCPGFNNALNKALSDYYRKKPCGDCPVTVEVIAAVRRVNVRGNCPKV